MGNVRVHLSAVTRDSLRQLAQIASRIDTKVKICIFERLYKSSCRLHILICNVAPKLLEISFIASQLTNNLPWVQIKLFQLN